MELLSLVASFILHVDQHLLELFRDYGVWIYAILFLIGPHSGHISGIDVLVDGGMSNMLMPASGGGTGQQRQR